jgi:hypothetical protein
MAGNGHVKGALLVHLRAHVIDRGGDAAWTSLVQRLPAFDRATLDSLLVSGSWYPVGIWNRALREHLVAHAADPGAEVAAIAHRIADADLHTVFKMLLKLASPEAVVRRVGWLWERYFDRGAMTPLEVAPSDWRVRLVDAPTGEDDGAGEATCAYGGPGWMTQALRLVGAKRAAVKHMRCRFAFAKSCEYRVTW